MKKSLFNKFSLFSGVQSRDSKLLPAPEYVPDSSEVMNIINEIFAVDPVSGLPNGDIAYYLSPNGNPTVKNWLMNNLLAPKFGERARNENLTDDMIAEFSRGAEESIDSYVSRMACYRDTAIQEYQKSLETKTD